ncbi:MAG: type II toxin-antitoxin system RelE/ParE family toxin [Ardenticatenales bacterium]|nr:type II toxin-antitoxin system RelE/ParE family toxin [Ardenticatenales bacterium]
MNEAAAYYARARPGLGEAFLIEVQRAVETLTEAPLAGTPVHREVRWRLVRRFPYRVYYRLHDDEVRILAVAHQKRRPLYWRARQ